MSEQLHNLGFLRMAVEDALVAHLTSKVGTRATIRPAFTTAEKEYPLVTVHASATRERNEDDYNLARFVDVELRVITYAAATDLLTAREAHFQLLSDVYHAMAQGDIVTQLNGLQAARVAFWSCYARTDEASIVAGAYMSIVQVEIGATPPPD
jgi:hypothetical protein